MDKFNAMSIGEKVIVVAGALLLIASFLPWYRYDFGLFDISRNGWQSPGAFWSILAVFVGLAMSGVIAVKTFTDVQLPPDVGGQSWGRVFLAGGALALLLVVFKFITESSDLSYGFYIGLLATLALAAGGALMYRDEGGVLPGIGGSGSQGGSPPSSSPPSDGPPASPPPSPPPSAPSGQ